MGYLILTGLVGVILGIIFTVVYYKRKLTYTDEIMEIKDMYRTADGELVGQGVFIKRTFSNGNIKTRLEKRYV